MTDPAPKATQLVKYLQKWWHRGEANAVTAADLVLYLGLSNDRDLRDVVRYARHELQEPICSLADKGYFYPTGPNDDALLHSIQQMQDMGIKHLENARAMETAVENKWPSDRLFEVV